MPSFQHLALSCRDRQATEKFYTEQFHFQRARVFNRGQPDEFVMLRRGSMCLELFKAKTETSKARGGEQEVGFKHMAFEVPDMDVAVAKLQAAGVETGPVIDAGRHVPGLRVCFFKDPEGNVVELMHGWQDETLA